MEFNSLSWSVISFILGTAFGHWLSLHRDKRKEFNDLADKIFLQFGRQATDPAPLTTMPGDDVRLLRRRMWWLERIRFDAAVDNYEKIASKQKTKSDGMGLIRYVDDTEIKKAAARVCKFLHRK
jgi:hypothetical protein